MGPVATARSYVSMTTSRLMGASLELMGGLLVAGATAFQAYRWYLDEEWLSLALLAAGAAAGLAGAFLLLRRRNRRELHDPRLVREKLDRVAFLAQLRLTVFAPPDADPRAVAARVGRV